MTNQPAGETTFYQQGPVTITNTRAVFWKTTYPLTNITSVGSGVVTSSPLLAFIVGIVGILVFIGAINAEGTGQIIGFGLGGLFMVAAFFMLRSAKPGYFVKLNTAGTDQRAYLSRDKAEIEKIVAALNEAIIKRG